MGTAIAMTDSEGQYIYVNPAYCELFGYEPGELLGEEVTMIGLESEEPERSPKGTIAYARKHAEGWRGEALRIDKRGRVIPVYLTVSPVRDERGELYGFLGDLIDLRSVKEWPPHLGGFALSLERLARKGGLEELGEAAAAEAAAVVGADTALIALFEPERKLLLRHWWVGYEDESPPREVQPHEGLWGNAIDQRRTLWIEEASEVDLDLVLMPGVEIEAVAIVPIVIGEAVVGVLMVGTFERAHAFGTHQISMLESIAGIVAAGIEREPTARIYTPSEEEDSGSSSTT